MRLQDARDARMGDLEPLRCYGGGDAPQGLPVGLHFYHQGDGLLLGLVLRELAVVAALEPERNRPAGIAPTGFVVFLTLADSLRETVANLAFAGHVASEVKDVQSHATALQICDDFERVRGRTEQAIEESYDDDIALDQLLEQGSTDRPIGNRSVCPHAPLFDDHAL